MTAVETKVLMSQADYAIHRGVTRQRINALKRKNRIVMVGDLVDAVASDKILPDVPETDHPPASSAPSSLDDIEPTTATSRAQLRKLEGEANLIELKLAKAAGAVIDRHETNHAVTTLYGELCEKLVGLGVRHAGRLMALKTEREFTTALTHVIEEELAAFASRLKDTFAAGFAADIPDESETEAPSDSSPQGGGDGDGDGADAAAAPVAE